MTTLAPFRVQVRANWGRWIADCPRCPSAEAMLSRHQPLFVCADCGLRAEIEWPPMTLDIERLLLMRPNVTNQNWEPGETLIDLMVENAEHGIFNDTDATLVVDAERIRVDTLPATHRRELSV